MFVVMLHPKPVDFAVSSDVYERCARRIDTAFHLLSGGKEPPGRAVFLRIANRVEGRILGRVVARIREPVFMEIWPDE